MVQLSQHRGLEQRWSEYPLAFQMANIGSEVSRSLHNQGNAQRFQGAYERALELFDLTIETLAEQPKRTGALRELCRAREQFCDYFHDNEFKTDPAKMQAYYNQFATLR